MYKKGDNNHLTSCVLLIGVSIIFDSGLQNLTDSWNTNFPCVNHDSMRDNVDSLSTVKIDIVKLLWNTNKRLIEGVLFIECQSCDHQALLTISAHWHLYDKSFILFKESWLLAYFGTVWISLSHFRSIWLTLDQVGSL